MPSPDEGAALLRLAPSKPNANQIMTGNNCGRAPVNHKTVNIMAQPRLETLRLPSPRAFASNNWKMGAMYFQVCRDGID